VRLVLTSVFVPQGYIYTSFGWYWIR